MRTALGRRQRRPGRRACCSPSRSPVLRDTDDWSRLWWVRADLEHVEDPPASLTDDLAARLAGTVPQYADQPFHRVLVCRIINVTGWAASDA